MAKNGLRIDFMEKKTLVWQELQKEVEGWKYLHLLDFSRLYYKPLESFEPKRGFQFKQIGLVRWSFSDMWQDRQAECEILLNGTAQFDGIRHLYFGDERTDNFGYYYYPSLQSILEALQRLKGLEEEYCSDLD